MTRSRVNSSETYDDSQNSILRHKEELVAIGIIEQNTSEEKVKENEDQLTLHTYEQHRKQEHYPHPYHGTVAMIERKAMKPHSPPPVMPTPTSTERRFTDSFYWISHLHKKIGLSHIILILVLATYSALGAIVFYYLEKPNERKVVAERKVELDTQIEHLAEYLSSVADNKTIEEMAIDVKVGSISPETDTGKWFVIVYGFIFVPVTLVVIRDLGQWLLLAITKIYARILLKYRRCCGKKSDKPNEVIHLPIVISVLIMIDEWNEQGEWLSEYMMKVDNIRGNLQFEKLHSYGWTWESANGDYYNEFDPIIVKRISLVDRSKDAVLECIEEEYDRLT
uniref:Ion_trans_2 domain-containing protein n=1 Tax=Angiostrongylus cantonensis TaxID=6313 RepID=A0A0K0DMH6_ANGCA